MQALEFQPILKRIRWGGTRLCTLLHKPCGPHGDYAESWEIVDRDDTQSVVLDGPFCGWTLGRLVCEHATELLGRHWGAGAHALRFPLLVKYLDAHDRLSVQVHPDDETALKLQSGECGKTEAWVILQAEAGSRLFAGLKSGVDRRALTEAVAQGRVADCLHSFVVAAGDCVHIPAGTVHSIGEGILLAEIQQSSDITFRLYDWGRVDAHGRPRTLHLAQALDCTDFARGPVDRVTPVPIGSGSVRVEELVRNDYFVLRRHVSTSAIPLERDDRCRVLMLLAGSAELVCGTERRRLALGATMLLPASAPESRVVPSSADGEAALLEAFVP